MHARRVLWSVADRSGFTHEAERRGARLVIADGRVVEVDFTRWSTGARCPTIGSRGSPSPEYSDSPRLRLARHISGQSPYAGSYELRRMVPCHFATLPCLLLARVHGPTSTD